MSSDLRLGLFTASLIVLVLILITVIKNKLNIKYSIIWIMWALMSLLMSIFPETFYSFSRLLGVELPVNGVFLIMIGLLYCLTFYSYLMISKHNKEIIDLTYEVASLKKKLEDKNK